MRTRFHDLTERSSSSENPVVRGAVFLVSRSLMPTTSSCIFCISRDAARKINSLKILISEPANPAEYSISMESLAKVR